MSKMGNYTDASDLIPGIVFHPGEILKDELIARKFGCDCNISTI